jgi:hypothetical protein
MPADQAWIARYKAAQYTDGPRPRSLSPRQWDVILAVRTYEPLPGSPTVPSKADLAEVAFVSVDIVWEALDAAIRLGLLDGPFE